MCAVIAVPVSARLTFQKSKAALEDVSKTAHPYQQTPYLPTTRATMARSVRHSHLADEEEEEDEEDLYSAPAAHRRPMRPSGRNSSSKSPSPQLSISSEKENRSAHNRPSGRLKGKGKAAMAPAARPSKRRRTEPLDTENASQVVIDEVADTLFYDPDQDMNERRAVRKGLRDLNRNLNGLFTSLCTLNPC